LFLPVWIRQQQEILKKGTVDQKTKRRSEREEEKMTRVNIEVPLVISRTEKKKGSQPVIWPRGEKNGVNRLGDAVQI